MISVSKNRNFVRTHTHRPCPHIPKEPCNPIFHQARRSSLPPFSRNYYSKWSPVICQLVWRASDNMHISMSTVNINKWKMESSGTEEVSVTLNNIGNTGILRYSRSTTLTQIKRWQWPYVLLLGITLTTGDLIPYPTDKEYPTHQWMISYRDPRCFLPADSEWY